MMPDLHLSDVLIQSLAQTLVHFVWQGLALWGAALAVLHVAGRSTQTRYAIHCWLLVLLAVTPLVTLCVIRSRAPLIVESSIDVAKSSTDRPAADLDRGSSYAQASAHVGSSTTHWLLSWLDEHCNWVVSLWLAGSVLMAIRLGLAAIGIYSIVRRRQPIPAAVATTVDRLARRMAFRVQPAVYAMERVSQAMAVGFFRPMVLLPAWWILELPADVLEAVIAHELAHLRRWDLPINLAQRIVESVLFFHPVVWWCSRRLRIEREMCCDELAQAAIGNRAVYAGALSYLAHRQNSPIEPLLAAGIGGPQMVLLARIRQVLGLASSGGRFYGTSCALIGALAASIIWAVALGVPQFQGVARPERVDEDSVTAGGVLSTPIARAKVPSERAKALLPNYQIEPPDVLFIEAIRMVPKGPYHIRSGDELSLIVEPEDTAVLRSSRGYFVDSEGRLDLGPRLGKLKVTKLTVEEAEALLVKLLAETLREPKVSLSVMQTSGLQPITGEHLVAPDGRVTLGMYGQVRVAAMTLEEARAAIENHLAANLDDPQVSVSAFAYNSKVYYVISESAGGDHVARLPITGSETVLDAISQVGGLTGLSKKKIWIARPTPEGTNSDLILPVNWSDITRGASTESNYQILPGDRIFIVEHGQGNPSRY